MAREERGFEIKMTRQNDGSCTIADRQFVF
jgi:hypothetical protein